MTKTTPTTYIFLLMLCLAQLSTAAQMMPAFEATYDITRGGKPTAEQHTKFKHQGPTQYHLSDVTKGTHGMASFTGFKRSETTQFELLNDGIRVNQHSMQQKVAFSKKKFNFNTDAQTNKVSGHYKGDFELTENVQPISAHLLPIWLSTKVCDSVADLTVPVLKSKNIKYYQFKSQQQDDNTVLVSRVYPATSDRSTQMWFDQNNHCLPIKTQHREGDDPVIVTTIKTFNFPTD